MADCCYSKDCTLNIPLVKYLYTVELMDGDRDLDEVLQDERLTVMGLLAETWASLERP